VRVTHDAAVLHISVFLKEALDFSFAELGRNSSNKKIRSLIGRFVFFTARSSS